MVPSELFKVRRKDEICDSLPSDNNHDPSNIIYYKGRYYMWFTQHIAESEYDDYDSCKIMMVSSVDGYNWTKPIDAFLPSQSGWDNGGVLTANVFRYNNRYYMWYIGVGKGYSGERRCGSLAVSDSPDKPFYRFLEKPALVPGNDGSWNELAVDDVSSIFFKGKWRTYFKGTSKSTDADHTMIGFATSDSPLGPFDFYESNPVNRGHAFAIWPYKEGLLLLSGLKDKADEGYIYRGDWNDPNGHQYLYWSDDGESFTPVAEFRNRAVGIYVPEGKNDDIAEFWGVSVNTLDSFRRRFIERFSFEVTE